MRAMLVGRVGDDELGQQARNNLHEVNKEVLGMGEGEVEWEGSVFSDGRLGTGVALQMIFDEDGTYSTTTKVTVVCGGANKGIEDKGPEVQHISKALTAYGLHAPEVILLQLEIGLGAMLSVAKSARRSGCLVAFKPSPLIPGKTGNVDAAGALLAYTDICFLNEVEAIYLLRSVAPASPALDEISSQRELITVADAEAVATALLAACPSLHTIFITCHAAHVLRQRGIPIPRGHSTLVAASRKLAEHAERAARKRGEMAVGARPGKHLVRGKSRETLFGKRDDTQHDLSLVVPRREVRVRCGAPYGPPAALLTDPPSAAPPTGRGLHWGC